MENTKSGEEFSSENLAQAVQKRYADDIKEVSASLEDAFQKEPRARLKEDIFVHVFLPFFALEENVYKVGLGNWETVASNGTPNSSGLFREVDIVNESGEYLYSIPPIYDRDAVKPVKLSDSIALVDLFKQAELLALIKPELTEKSNNRIFTELLKKMKVSEHNSEEYLKRWYDIFKRYGKLKVDPEVEEQKKIAQSSNYEIEDL